MTKELLANEHSPVGESGWRVLLVEDNAIAARVAQWILQDLHCAVDVAPDPHTALQLMKANHYDTIFMDIGLPDMDGFQLTALIHHDELWQTRPVPIVALSAHTDITEQPSYVDLGMKAAIVKPLTREKAAAVLHQLGLPFVQRVQSSVGDTEAGQHLAEWLSLAVIDLETLKKYISADPGIYQPLLKEFLASLPDFRLRLEQAFVGEDWQAFSACTHKLNGSAGYYGAQQLKAICSQLQHLPADTAIDYIAPRFQQLQQALANLLAYEA